MRKSDRSFIACQLFQQRLPRLKEAAVIAFICDRSMSTVRRWFKRGRKYRPPTAADLRHLALMDFLLEHYEDIPEQLLNALCFPKRNL